MVVWVAAKEDLPTPCRRALAPHCASSHAASKPHLSPRRFGWVVKMPCNNGIRSFLAPAAVPNWLCLVSRHLERIASWFTDFVYVEGMQLTVSWSSGRLHVKSSKLWTNKDRFGDFACSFFSIKCSSHITPVWVFVISDSARGEVYPVGRWSNLSPWGVTTWSCAWARCILRIFPSRSDWIMVSRGNRYVHDIRIFYHSNLEEQLKAYDSGWIFESVFW